MFTKSISPGKHLYDSRQQLQVRLPDTESRTRKETNLWVRIPTGAFDIQETYPPTRPRPVERILFHQEGNARKLVPKFKWILNKGFMWCMRKWALKTFSYFPGGSRVHLEISSFGGACWNGLSASWQHYLRRAELECKFTIFTSLSSLSLTLNYPEQINYFELNLKK